jgi:hypothetical protein
LPPRRVAPDAGLLQDASRREPHQDGVRRPPSTGRNGHQATNYQH